MQTYYVQGEWGTGRTRACPPEATAVSRGETSAARGHLEQFTSNCKELTRRESHRGADLIPEDSEGPRGPTDTRGGPELPPRAAAPAV